jgi:hypothetical protein
MVNTGAPVAEVGVTIFAGHVPVLAECPLDTAADGPAPARAIAAIGCHEGARGNRDARAVDDGGRGAADPGDCSAAGDVEQGAVDREAGASAERGHPVDTAEVDRHCLVDRGKDERGPEGAHGAGAGAVQSGALPVGFQAQHELIDLPVVTDLTAADHAALAAGAGERGQLPGKYGRDRGLRRKHNKAGEQRSEIAAAIVVWSRLRRHWRRFRSRSS